MVKKIFNILGTVVLVLLVCIVILMFNARISGEAPSVFGYQVYRVSSGSMEPELMIGDVILVKAVEPSEIEIGDTITYYGTSGDFRDKYITHKVVDISGGYGGMEYVFTTKGILPGAVEDPLVSQSQVAGVLVRKIPFINSLYTFFLSDYGLITFVGIIIILFGYELISLIVSYKTMDEFIESDDTPDDKSQKKE